jgi:hypothetical protein
MGVVEQCGIPILTLAVTSIPCQSRGLILAIGGAGDRSS